MIGVLGSRGGVNIRNVFDTRDIRVGVVIFDEPPLCSIVFRSLCLLPGDAALSNAAGSLSYLSIPTLFLSSGCCSAQARVQV